LDLKKIALQARNAEYNPKRFAAVIMRIRDPKTTALIFASGKMVCTGAKSEDHSKLAARKVIANSHIVSSLFMLRNACCLHHAGRNCSLILFSAFAELLYNNFYLIIC
jgi:hypothetical protein